jgi:hypothetical protein
MQLPQFNEHVHLGKQTKATNCPNYLLCNFPKNRALFCAFADSYIDVVVFPIGLTKGSHFSPAILFEILQKKRSIFCVLAVPL